MAPGAIVWRWWTSGPASMRVVSLQSTPCTGSGWTVNPRVLGSNPSRLTSSSRTNREAVLSSQIKGAQSTLDDVLAFELTGAIPSLPGDVAEVVNQ